MPPASPFLHGVARIRLTHSVCGLRQSNVFHVQDLTGTATVEHYQAILTQFAFWWRFGYLDGAAPSMWMGHDVSLDLLAVEWLADRLLPGPLSVLYDLVGFPGGGSSASVPASATPALTWYTAFMGHYGHGRTYLVGLDSALLEDGHSSYVEPGAVPLIERSYQVLIDALRDATDPPGLFELCLFHRRGRPVDLGGLVWADPLTTCRFRDRLLDTQRPRLPGHRK